MFPICRCDNARAVSLVAKFALIQRYRGELRAERPQSEDQLYDADAQRNQAYDARGALAASRGAEPATRKVSRLSMSAATRSKMAQTSCICSSV